MKVSEIRNNTTEADYRQCLHKGLWHEQLQKVIKNNSINQMFSEPLTPTPHTPLPQLQGARWKNNRVGLLPGL